MIKESVNHIANFNTFEFSTIKYSELRKWLFFTSVVFIFLVIPKVEIEWKWAHIFFSYQYGFLKRGLIGELLRWSPIPTNLDNFKVMSVLMLLGVAVAFFNIVKSESNKVFIGFALFFLSSPLLLKNLVFDWGRLDQIAIMVIFLQILWVGEEKKSFYLLLLSPLLIFMHEGTIFWAFPTIVAIAYFENRKTLYWLVPILLLSVLIIFLWGGLEMAPDKYLQLLEDWAKPNSVHWAIVVTLTASLKDSISYSVPALITNIHSDRGHIAIALLVAHTIPMVLYKNKLLIVFNVLALISASALFLVANDHFRWIALMGMINLFFLLYAYKKSLIKNLEIMSGYLLLMSVLGLFMSPIGVF